MDDDRPILRYWGKAKPQTSSGPQWHPLVYHSLDVAACGRKLLEADKERRRGLARLSGLKEESLLAWLSFLLAIHDLGKFSDGFQNLRPPDLFQLLQGRATRANYDERHDTLGWLLSRQDLPAAFTPNDAEALWYLLAPWVSAVTGHHGRPPKLPEKSTMSLLKHQFPPPVRQDASRFVQEAARLLLPHGLPFSTSAYGTLYPLFVRASWLVAGLAVAGVPHACGDEPYKGGAAAITG